MASLSTVSTIDTESICLSLNTLNKQIDTLPLKKAAQPAPITSDKNDSWWGNLQDTMKKLNGLIKVRRHEEASQTILQEETINQLYQNLHIHFSTAQYALLQKQNMIYHQSLQQVTEWVNRYFDTQADATQKWLASVSRLEQININPSIPDIDLPTLKEGDLPPSRQTMQPAVPPVAPRAQSPATPQTPTETPAEPEDEQVPPNVTDQLDTGERAIQL